MYDPKVLLQNWAVENQISHSTLGSLLSILKSTYDEMLPLDPRTLLKTPSKPSVSMCYSI